MTRKTSKLWLTVVLLLIMCVIQPSFIFDNDIPPTVTAHEIETVVSPEGILTDIPSNVNFSEQKGIRRLKEWCKTEDANTIASLFLYITGLSVITLILSKFLRKKS